MRLTLKELELLDTASAYNGEQHKAICGKAALELIEYKKIEEELGIDLITLFKALRDSIAIKNEDGTITVMWACPRFQISLDRETAWILYGPITEQKFVNIKDYGKTWALTKEELE